MTAHVIACTRTYMRFTLALQGAAQRLTKAITH